MDLIGLYPFLLLFLSLFLPFHFTSILLNCGSSANYVFFLSFFNFRASSIHVLMLNFKHVWIIKFLIAINGVFSEVSFLLFSVRFSSCSHTSMFTLLSFSVLHGFWYYSCVLLIRTILFSYMQVVFLIGRNMRLAITINLSSNDFSSNKFKISMLFSIVAISARG